MLLPLSFDLTGKKILLVGGGRAALEKFNQLCRTGCDLRIITPALCPELETALAAQHASRITLETRQFLPADIDGAYMVFSAVDDTEAAQKIFELCRTRGILINSADDKARCDFFTNALIDRGSVQLSVSTNGRFAGLSAILKRHLEALFPGELDADWENIFALRERAVALQSVSEKKSVITDIVRQIENRYFKKEEK